MNTAYKRVKNFSKEQLEMILDEINYLGSLEAPRKAKQSDILNELLLLEKTKYNYWSDQFSSVRRAVELEILHRVGKRDW